MTLPYLTDSATLLDVDLLCGHCGEKMPESIQDRVYMSMSELLFFKYTFLRFIFLSVKADDVLHS